MEMSRTPPGIIAAFGTGRSSIHLDFSVSIIRVRFHVRHVSFACDTVRSIYDSTWCIVFQLSYSSIKLRVATVP